MTASSIFRKNPVNVTFYPVDVTFYPVNVTLFPVNVTHRPVDVTFVIKKYPIINLLQEVNNLNCIKHIKQIQPVLLVVVIFNNKELSTKGLVTQILPKTPL